MCCSYIELNTKLHVIVLPTIYYLDRYNVQHVSNTEQPLLESITTYIEHVRHTQAHAHMFAFKIHADTPTMLQP